MARLLKFFAPLLSFGQSLSADLRMQRPLPDLQQMQQQALALLEQAQQLALAENKSPAQFERARFAMVAWFDEILARAPQWQGAQGSLQQQLFNSSNAASEFFHHLATLSADEEEVREVYWQALMLGFKGQYYFEQDDHGELGKLKRLHERPWQPQAPSSASLHPVVHSRFGPALAQSDLRRRNSLLWTLTLLCLLSLGIGWWFSHPRPPTNPMNQRIAQQLQRFACADLTIDLTPQGHLLVTGFVSRPEDISQLHSELNGLAPSAQLEVQLRRWPHCEVMAILQPYRRPVGTTTDARLAVLVPSAHGDRLEEGRTVHIAVQVPPHARYLLLDYYTADGAVMHLHRSTQMLSGEGARTVLLGPDIPASWLVSPPFGEVLVTAVTSSQPFDVGNNSARAPFELASEYLLQLREMLATPRDQALLQVASVFLHTAERQER